MKTRAPRLLLDSNVLTDGLVSRFGQSKAVLALCAAKTCRLVLPEINRIEVERNLIKLTGRLGADQTEKILGDLKGFLKLARPITVPLADEKRVDANRSLIRHLSDVPVVLAAIDSQPDWIITKNRDHFTDEVSARIGIRIGSPQEFFQALIDNF
jgi:predicted nucleic acid-binding protein